MVLGLASARGEAVLVESIIVSSDNFSHRGTFMDIFYCSRSDPPGISSHRRNPDLQSWWPCSVLSAPCGDGNIIVLRHLTLGNSSYSRSRDRAYGRDFCRPEIRRVGFTLHFSSLNLTFHPARARKPRGGCCHRRPRDEVVRGRWVGYPWELFHHDELQDPHRPG